MINWVKTVASGDAEAIWNAIYSLVRDHRPILPSRDTDGQCEQSPSDEINADITQEVFLRLLTTDRLSFFIANEFTSDQIESELILSELATVLLSQKEKPAQAPGRSPIQDQKISPSGCNAPAFLAAPIVKPA